jgi:hypothetical protein
MGKFGYTVTAEAENDRARERFFVRQNGRYIRDFSTRERAEALRQRLVREQERKQDMMAEQAVSFEDVLNGQL